MGITVCYFSPVETETLPKNDHLNEFYVIKKFAAVIQMILATHECKESWRKLTEYFEDNSQLISSLFIGSCDHTGSHGKYEH